MNPFILKTFAKFSILFTLTLYLTSCHHDHEHKSNPTPAQGALTIEFHNHWADEQHITTLDTFRLGDKRSIKISTANYIISNIRLIDASGKEVKVDTKGFVVDGAKGSGHFSFEAGSFPVGDYKGIRFYVGLDSATNHQDVTKLAQNDPLNRPDMGWSWDPALGYRFVMFEAYYDTAPTVDTQHVTLTGPLAYHLATDQLFTEITALKDSSFSITSAGLTLNIGVEWLKLFEGVNVLTENTTHSMGSELPLALKLKGNLNGMFSLDE